MGDSNTLAPARNSWSIFICTLLFVLAAAKLAVMLWSVKKGFDLGDEGLYMLSLADPERYTVLAHGYFLNKILPINDFTIPISRTISICLELGGGLIFSWGLYRWMAKYLNVASFWLIWALVLTGSFQSILARCVSYNDLVNFFGLASAGLLLFSFTLDAGKKQLAVWTATAVVATFCTIFKAPVAMSLSGLYLFVIMFHSSGKRLQTLGKALLAWLVGAAITALLYTLLYNGLGWTDIIAQVKQTADLLNYRPIDLLLMYVIYDGLPNLIFIGLGVGIYALFTHVAKRITPEQPLIIFLAAASITAFLGIGAIIKFKILLIPEEQAVYPYLWVVMGIMLLLLWNGVRLPHYLHFQYVAVALLLFALPIGMIGGTNGFITETLFAFWIPWFGLIGVSLYYLAATHLPFVKYPILIVALAVATGLQFYHSKVQHPFGLPSLQTLFHQTEPLPGRDNLMVDTKSAEFFKAYQAALQERNVLPGRAIIGMNYMPGLVYLAQGYSPSAPFYLYGFDFKDYNCHNLYKAAATETQAPIIIYRSSLMTFPAVFMCLDQPQWNWPKGYRYNEIVDPYSSVYEQSGQNDGMLYIWVPE